MADRTTQPDRDGPLPNADDPGGAHRKGYTADPRPEKPVPDNDPVPLAADSEVKGHVRKPDQTRAVGSTESGGYSDNDRLMGSDR